MQAIERKGLLMIPRVTDMRNGTYRPEVVWSRGKSSDIVFGELHVSRVRCAAIAEHAALAAVMMNEKMNGAWEECARGLANCQRVADMLMAAF